MDNDMPTYGERQATRAKEMMQRLNVDTVKLTLRDNGAAYIAVRAKCLTCVDARECIHWLDANPGPADAPGFCPNVAVYQDCKRDTQ